MSEAIIVKAGEVAKQILFIEQGLIRSYSEIKGEKASNYFMREGDIIIAVESFLQQIPSFESIEALEDCVCWGITFDELEETYQKFMSFNIHGRKITSGYYCKSEARHRSKHFMEPEEKYEWLMTNDPALLGRVLDSHMQSYLETSKTTYYRIRKNYARRKKKRS